MLVFLLSPHVIFILFTKSSFLPFGSPHCLRECCQGNNFNFMEEISWRAKINYLEYWWRFLEWWKFGLKWVPCQMGRNLLRFTAIWETKQRKQRDTGRGSPCECACWGLTAEKPNSRVNHQCPENLKRLEPSLSSAGWSNRLLLVMIIQVSWSTRETPATFPS